MSSMSAPLFVGGVPTMGMNGLPTTFGNVFFVDYENGSNGNTGTSMKSPFKTIAYALSMCVTNNDDVIVLRGHATAHPATDATASNTATMLTTSINRVHLVGLDGAWRAYGQGARIQLTATTGATNIAVLKNTGVRNSFTNIKFDNESTVTQSVYGVVEGGEYAQYTNCEFYNGKNYDATGAADFVLNGDSTQFKNCTFGSLATPLSGDILRPCVLLTKAIAGTGLVTRDAKFEDCTFWRNASHVDNVFVYAAADSDVERLIEFKRCGFIYNRASAAKPAVCISTPTLTTGHIILDPACYTNCTKIATATGIIVTGAAPNSGTGIGVNAA